MATANITYNGSDISSVDENTPVAVTYNGSTIVSIASGQTKTLQCAGKLMATNVVVGSKTLQCAGKVMASDVSIVVQGAVETVTITMTGTLTASSQNWGYVKINGTNYYNATTLTVNQGTSIEFWVKGAWLANGWIEINGDRQKTSSSSGITRTMTANSNVSISLASSYGYGRITANGGT